jgi:hypothetical protein
VPPFSAKPKRADSTVKKEGSCWSPSFQLTHLHRRMQALSPFCLPHFPRNLVCSRPSSCVLSPGLRFAPNSPSLSNRIDYRKCRHGQWCSTGAASPIEAFVPLSAASPAQASQRENLSKVTGRPKSKLIIRRLSLTTDRLPAVVQGGESQRGETCLEGHALIGLCIKPEDRPSARFASMPVFGRLVVPGSRGIRTELVASRLLYFTNFH